MYFAGTPEARNKIDTWIDVYRVGGGVLVELATAFESGDVRDRVGSPSGEAWRALLEIMSDALLEVLAPEGGMHLLVRRFP